MAFLSNHNRLCQSNYSNYQPGSLLALMENHWDSSVLAPPLPPFSIQCPNKDLITILSRENFTSDNACRKDGTALDLASGDLCLGEILTLQLFFRQIRSKALAKSFPMKACWCFCISHPPTPHRPWVWMCWCTVDGLPSTQRCNA